MVPEETSTAASHVMMGFAMQIIDVQREALLVLSTSTGSRTHSFPVGFLGFPGRLL